MAGQTCRRWDRAPRFLVWSVSPVTYMPRETRTKPRALSCKGYTKYFTTERNAATPPLVKMQDRLLFWAFTGSPLPVGYRSSRLACCCAAFLDKTYRPHLC